ncbi:MAG: hypothetical protein ACLPID_13305 [Beijerinckiaceae bacterium]
MSVATAVGDLVDIFLGNNIDVGGTVVSWASLLKGLGALGQVNWSGVIAAIEAGDWETDIVPVEDILRVVGLFVPPVAVAEADFEALLPIIQFMIANTNAAGAESPAGQNPTYDAIFPTTYKK